MLRTSFSQLIFACVDYVHARDLLVGAGTLLITNNETHAVRHSIGGEWELVPTATRSWVWEDHIEDAFVVAPIPDAGTTGRALRPKHFYARVNFRIARPLGTPYAHTHWVADAVSNIRLASHPYRASSRALPTYSAMLLR